MRARDFQRTVRPFLDDTWDYIGPLAFKRPVGWNLYGILGESTGVSRTACRPWLVRMPTYRPAEVIDLSWSVRVGGGTRTFELDDADLSVAITSARHACDRENSNTAVRLPQDADHLRNLSILEVQGYAAFLDGDLGGAMTMLGDVRGGPNDAGIPWVQEMIDRASATEQLITGGDVSAVRSLLAGWRDATLDSLGITERIPSADLTP